MAFGFITLFAFTALILLYLWSNHTQPPLDTRFVQNSRQNQDGALFEQSDAVKIKSPPEYVNLGSINHIYQTFNNCGPAALSMVLSWHGVEVSQEELGDKMRPFQNPNGDNDDKSILTKEFAGWAEKYGLNAIARPNGDLETLKLFTANNIPVVVKTFLEAGDDIGHFRIVKGYDNSHGFIIQDDSYDGPNRRISYYDFLNLWQPFHYVYIIVYSDEQKPVVEAIIAGEMDEKTAWSNLLDRSKQESDISKSNVMPIFNMAVSHYHLGNYRESVQNFEEIESELPRRMLWYQLEPILSYQMLGDYERVFEISDRIINNGNRAFSELYLIRGEIYEALGDINSARLEYEKAVFYNANLQAAIEALELLVE